MELLSNLLRQDGASPRLTVYDNGRPVNFSGVTLDNWAAKVGNMLLEEFDLEPGSSSICLDLPAGWQAAAIVLGAMAAGITWHLFPADSDVASGSDVLFTTMDRVQHCPTISDSLDVALLTTDPFGRGVEEMGGTVPVGMVDFGPTVRIFGDQFHSPTPTLTELVTVPPGIPEGIRLLSPGWSDKKTFTTAVLVPLSVGGSAVIVTGLHSREDLEHIAAIEHATLATKL